MYSEPNWFSLSDLTSPAATPVKLVKQNSKVMTVVVVVVAVVVVVGLVVVVVVDDDDVQCTG